MFLAKQEAWPKQMAGGTTAGVFLVRNLSNHFNNPPISMFTVSVSACM